MKVVALGLCLELNLWKGDGKSAEKEMATVVSGEHTFRVAVAPEASVEPYDVVVVRGNAVATKTGLWLPDGSCETASVDDLRYFRSTVAEIQRVPRILGADAGPLGTAVVDPRGSAASAEVAGGAKGGK